jgi:DNA polymerase/3'-5' exonuclease PolX
MVAGAGSQKVEVSWEKAMDVGARFRELIEDTVLRMEIAGAARRRRPIVGDLELLCIPRVWAETDMFGSTMREVDDLHDRLEELRAAGVIYQLGGWGPKHKTFGLDGVTIDLYTATAETWGCQLLIRTGPWQFSKRAVTQRSHGGLCPPGLKFQEGRLWLTATDLGTGLVSVVALQTPEETDVFAALGLRYLEPEDRR